MTPFSIATLLGCVGLAPLAAWLVGSLMVRWKKSLSAPSAAPPAEDFRLATPDGLAIAATYWPGWRQNSPAVLLLHGLGDARQAVAANAEWLANKGFAALAIDFRGHGQSSRAPHAFGLTESIDARTGFDWLKIRQQGAPIGVIGISLGGAASLLGANGPLPADALVLQAVFPDIRRAIRNRIAAFLPAPFAWALEPLLSYQSRPRFGIWPDRLAPIEALADYRRPVLVVGGAADAYTPPAESREIFAAATQGRELLLLEGLDHDQASATQSDAYRDKILTFFSSTLGSP
jgi:alpha-beta hydrolase superfamily lysophospholipase